MIRQPATGCGSILRMGSRTGPVSNGVVPRVSDAVRLGLERWPALYVRVARWRGKPGQAVLDDATDLVIEGFPRSGNTFLLSSIAHANPELRIASHLHSVAHVRVAIRKRIPVIVVLREPEDAVASELIRLQAGSEPTITRQLLSRYERFYRGVREALPDVVLSPFPVTTTAPEKVVQAVADRTGLSLTAVPSAQMQDVLADVENKTIEVRGYLDEMAVARPSPERTELADELRTGLRHSHPDVLAHLQVLHDELAASPAAVR
jgi:hypothetical protein